MTLTLLILVSATSSVGSNGFLQAALGGRRYIRSNGRFLEKVSRMAYLLNMCCVSGSVTWYSRDKNA